MQPQDQVEPVSLLTLEDVAKRLKVSIFTVRRWVHQGELPAYRVGRGWRIATTDLGKWLETHRQAQEPGVARHRNLPH